MRTRSLAFLVFWKQNLLKLFPQDGKQNTLHTIGQNLGLQTTEEQSSQSTFRNHSPHNLWIGNCLRTTLLVHFHHPNGIGTGITHGTGTKSHNGSTAQFSQLGVLLWNFFTKVIVGKKPGVMSYKCCRSAGQTSMIQYGKTIGFDFGYNIGEFSRHLHGSFDCINWHEKNSKDGS